MIKYKLFYDKKNFNILAIDIIIIKTNFNFNSNFERFRKERYQKIENNLSKIIYYNFNKSHYILKSNNKD